MSNASTAPAAPTEGEETQVTIPKEQLPDCKVGEMLKIVGEDGDNFVVSPNYDEGADESGAGDQEMPSAVKAIMGR